MLSELGADEVSTSTGNDSLVVTSVICTRGGATASDDAAVGTMDAGEGWSTTLVVG